MTCTRFKVGGVGLLALGVACSAAAARADTVLRYKFRDGEKLQYVIEQKIKMEMKVQGNDVAMDMTQVVDMTWQVQSVDAEGKAKMVQRFDRYRFTMNGPMGKVEYDSKDGKLPAGPLGELLGPFFEALAGAEFRLSMDARGKTSDVTIPAKVAEALKKMPSGGNELFSEEGFKRLVSQGGLVVPGEALVKGQSWNQELDMKMPFGKMKVVNTNTYEGPATRAGRELEQIALRPKLTLEADPDAALSAKLQAQEAKGTAYFDKDAGRLVETILTQTLTMDISAGGQNLTQKLEQAVSLKLIDKAK